MVKNGIYINSYVLPTTSDKLSRARSIQARMRAAACKFDKEADWYLDFEDELLKFPRDKHDDQVDAWAHMGLMLDKMWQADTPKEEEEEEYDEMVKGASGGEGRNATTGY
jgi:phage terminase large subunit-like protein